MNYSCLQDMPLNFWNAKETLDKIVSGLPIDLSFIFFKKLYISIHLRGIINNK